MEAVAGIFWSAAVGEKPAGTRRFYPCIRPLRNEWGRMPLLVTRSAGSGKKCYFLERTAHGGGGGEWRINTIIDSGDK